MYELQNKKILARFDDMTNLKTLWIKECKSLEDMQIGLIKLSISKVLDIRFYEKMKFDVDAFDALSLLINLHLDIY